MRMTPRRILRATGALLLPVGLVYAALWWGAAGGGRDPGLPVLESQANSRPDPATSALLLKELVTRETSLRTEGLTEWEMVNRIRDWAHANIDVSTKSYLLDQNASFKFYTRPAPEIFAAFFADRGGVWCGGAAYVLMELYKLFGFSASTLDFGKPDVMMHVVTLVQIRFDGAQKTLIRDATLNLTYVTDGGRPYDYFELLAVLLRHEHQKVHVVSGRRRGGDALVDSEDTDLPFDPVVDFRRQPIQVLPNGIRKYESRLTLRSFEGGFGAKIRAFLRAEGHPGELPYLLLYPLAASDPAILSEAQRVTKREAGGPVRGRPQSGSAG